jgi:hypothetical protein
VNRAGQNLLEQNVNQAKQRKRQLDICWPAAASPVASLFVVDKAPQIELQVVAVHLDLLQAVPAESLQADALEEGLKGEKKALKPGSRPPR